MSLPQIYPKPIAFYQHPAFEGEACQLVPPDTDLSQCRLFNAGPAFVARIFQQLQLTKTRHVGRLRGEYMLQQRCLLALDRNGAPIKLNTDAGDDWAMSSLFSELETFCAQPVFPLYRDKLLETWENAPVASNLVVLGGTHADHNYYHFSVCMLPQIRHFADSPATCIGLPEKCVERRFQLDLIQFTFGHRTVTPLPDGVRVIDPMLIYEPITVDGIRWLRKRTGLRAPRGNRLIHITRRSSQTGRVGGCIEDTPDFQDFLARHGFENIDFGIGDITLPDQVAMLDGARVIFSAHGANLTNIAYVEQGVSVIEVLPYYWSYFSHMQIAAAVGLPYHGVICHEVNEQQNMEVNVLALEQALAAALAATPATNADGNFFPTRAVASCEW